MSTSLIDSALLQRLKGEARTSLGRPYQNVTRSHSMSQANASFVDCWINGWTGSPNWINYGLIYDGVVLPGMEEHYPETITYLQNASPNICMAGFAILRPQSQLPVHVDERVSIGACSYHLGLSVPESCALVVQDQTIWEEEGKLIQFDDALPHYAPCGIGSFCTTRLRRGLE